MENIEQLRFKIAQLRQDKIIYAVEAVAMNTAAIIAVYFADRYFPRGLELMSYIIAFLVGPGYSLFMGITNFDRLQKIKTLERKLEELLEKGK